MSAGVRCGLGLSTLASGTGRRTFGALGACLDRYYSTCSRTGVRRLLFEVWKEPMTGYYRSITPRPGQQPKLHVPMFSPGDVTIPRCCFIHAVDTFAGSPEFPPGGGGSCHESANWRINTQPQWNVYAVHHGLDRPRADQHPEVSKCLFHIQYQCSIWLHYMPVTLLVTSEPC